MCIYLWRSKPLPQVFGRFRKIIQGPSECAAQSLEDTCRFFPSVVDPHPKLFSLSGESTKPYTRSYFHALIQPTPLYQVSLEKMKDCRRSDCPCREGQWSSIKPSIDGLSYEIDSRLLKILHDHRLGLILRGRGERALVARAHREHKEAHAVPQSLDGTFPGSAQVARLPSRGPRASLSQGFCLCLWDPSGVLGQRRSQPLPDIQVPLMQL